MRVGAWTGSNRDLASRRTVRSLSIVNARRCARALEAPAKKAGEDGSVMRLVGVSPCNRTWQPR